MRNKVIKIVISIVCCLCVAVAPLFFGVLYAFKLPSQYDETYVAAMSDKVKHLKSIDEEKVVLVGGSNLPFGIDSGILAQKLNKPIVNFGLYAALGTKMIMDLSKSGLNKGDTVIFAIEYSSQTYSKYINPETTLQMLDADYSLTKYINADDMLQIYGDVPKFIENKKRFIELDLKPSPSGPYSRDSFNEHGDIIYPRKYNVMPQTYDAANLISIDKDIIAPDFIEYFNDYVKWAKRKKIDVLISFPPINRQSLSVESNFEKRLEFYDFICDNFDAEVISNIEDYIIHEDYFYDSNYHLNDSGVIYRTNKLLGDIKRYLGDTSANGILVPEGSGAAPEEEGSEEITEGNAAENFEIDFEDNKAVILGLSQKGKLLSDVTIPSMIDGLKVYKIADRAFADNPSIKSLVIPSSVQILGGKLFENSPQLKEVYLLLPNDVTSLLPQFAENILSGASNELKIYVPKNWYSKITTDYFWGRLSTYISAIK